MSFINSIFVDAMVADNNDELLEKINQLQKSIDELKKQNGCTLG
jgi:voltage-gated sodium channel